MKNIFVANNKNLSGINRKERKHMIYNIKESGRRIKELRKQKGYTQESFADDIGISVRTYSGIESGAHSTSIDTL